MTPTQINVETQDGTSTKTVRRLQPKWTSNLGPTIVISSVLQIGGYIWFAATLQARVTNMELRARVTEDRLANLHVEFVPRKEHEDAAISASTQRGEDQRRLDRIESKLDILLEQSHRN